MPSLVGSEMCIRDRLNSSVGQQEQPVLAQANITQISPANTNPTLTQGPDYSTGTKKRPFVSYFRTATTDSVQGPFAAQYVVQTLGKKKVALVNDKKTYGAGLVAEFKKELTKEGGSVVADETINLATRTSPPSSGRSRRPGRSCCTTAGSTPRPRCCPRR